MTTQTIDYLNSRPQSGDMRFGRSKVSNSPDLILGRDGRSITCRRFRDLVKSLIADAGGVEACSTAKLQLLRRLAAASVLAEMMEAKGLDGEQFNVAEFCNLASTALRLSAKVGLSRFKKDVTPRLATYLEGQDATQEQESEDAA
jgi:hypothetical protein